jgi:hypothetical protein
VQELTYIRCLYEDAARIGCWRGFKALAEIYKIGRGVSPDSRRASYYGRRAARGKGRG